MQNEVKNVGKNQQHSNHYNWIGIKQTLCYSLQQGVKFDNADNGRTRGRKSARLNMLRLRFLDENIIKYYYLNLSMHAMQ